MAEGRLLYSDDDCWLACFCFLVHPRPASQNTKSRQDQGKAIPIMSARPACLENICWYSREMLPWPIPPNLQPWLLHGGSLTERLQSSCGGAFRVELLSQAWQVPSPDECRFLKISPAACANVREVLLVCGGVPQVFARSILPADLLHGGASCLLSLGDKPLGHFLFSRSTVQRRFVGFARVMNERNQPLWGRRSFFSLPEGGLSVYEYFLPGQPPLRPGKEGSCVSES